MKPGGRVGRTPGLAPVAGPARGSREPAPEGRSAGVRTPIGVRSFLSPAAPPAKNVVDTAGRGPHPLAPNLFSIVRSNPK